MSGNKVRKIAIVMYSVLAVLLAVIALNFAIHAVRTVEFNNQPRTLSSGEEAAEVSVSGSMTGEWPKGDALVPNVTNGGTYELTIENTADYSVATWTLRLDITDECYLNQAWNGTVEVHQGVAAGNEKVETLDLHNFQIDYGNLTIEYAGEGKNYLMIPLHPGDYLIYHPLSNDLVREYPLGQANNAVTIGLIFYYNQTFDEPTFELSYQFGKSIFQGTEFTIFSVLSILWVIIFIGALVWTIVRKKAEADLAEREAMLEETMGLITSFVDAKDAYTNGHSNRVAEYSVLLAKRLGMPEREVRHVFYTAILHDVGKCYVPDEILKKKGRLTDEEFETIKKHTVYGGEMLKSINTISHISEGAKHHHERYDGKGYPEGLSGEGIPYVARIICVADAFDAMTSSRCYRDALSKDYTLNELKTNMGKQFDPKVCQALLDMISEGKIAIESWGRG